MLSHVDLAFRIIAFDRYELIDAHLDCKSQQLPKAKLKVLGSMDALPVILHYGQPLHVVVLEFPDRAELVPPKGNHVTVFQRFVTHASTSIKTEENVRGPSG